MTPRCFVSELDTVFTLCWLCKWPPGEEVAQRVCPTCPRWSTPDLSTVLHLNGMTEVLRNFSALCLNQPVKTLPLGWARSSVTSPLALTWPPLLLKYDLQIPDPGLSNLSEHCLLTCIQKMSLLATECAAESPLPTCRPGFAKARFLHLVLILSSGLWSLPVLLRARVKANERLHPDVGEKLHSWANSHCLLYSMTCLKWHAGPKRRRPAELWGAESGQTLITW